MQPSQPASNEAVTTRAAEIDFRRLWFVLKSNWRLMAIFTVLALGVGAVVLKRTTPIYEARSSVRLYGSQTSMSPLEQLKNPGAETGISTDIEVLRSRRLAESVADTLKLQMGIIKPAALRRSDVLSDIAIEGEVESSDVYVFQRTSGGKRTIKNVRTEAVVGTVTPGERFSIGPASAVLSKQLPDDDIHIAVRTRQGAADALSKYLTLVRPNRDASLLIAKYSGPDPEIVRDIPNALIAGFMERRGKLKREAAAQAVAFIRSQLDTLSGQLTGAEDSTRTFRESEGVVNLQGEAISQVGKLADLRAQRDAAASELSALSALMAEIQSSATRSGETSPYRRLLAFPTLMRNPASSDLLSALNQADIERQALSSRRTGNDPDLIALNTRVAQLEGSVKTMVQTYLQGLRSQVAANDATLARFNADLIKIPAKEIESARLDRSTKVLSDMYTLLQTRLKEAQIASASEDASAEIVDVAVLPQKPVWPRRSLVLLISLVAGLSIGVVTAFIRDMSDRTVHTHSDVEAITGVDNLGLIPNIVSRKSRKGGDKAAKGDKASKDPGVSMALVAGRDPRSIVAEAYRSLRSNIMFAHPDRPHKIVMFTSPVPGDGKTTTITNLATNIAQQGQKVLIVDADLRRGMTHNMFGIPLAPGLSEMIAGKVPEASAIRHVQIPRIGSIDVVTAGEAPFNPTELLGGEVFKTWLKSVAPRYDYVLIDTPPVNLFTDAVVMALAADAVMLVARAGKTQKGELAYAMDNLRRVSAPILGTVLNAFDAKREAKYGDGHYYSYGQNYGSYAQYGTTT